MMIKLRLVSQEHSQLPTKSFRLSPGLRVNAALSFLGCLRHSYCSLKILISIFCLRFKFLMLSMYGLTHSETGLDFMCSPISWYLCCLSFLPFAIRFSKPVHFILDCKFSVADLYGQVLQCLQEAQFQLNCASCNECSKRNLCAESFKSLYCLCIYICGRLFFPQINAVLILVNKSVQMCYLNHLYGTMFDVNTDSSHFSVRPLMELMQLLVM